MENIIVYYSTSSQRTEITNPDICRLKKKPLCLQSKVSGREVPKTECSNAGSKENNKTNNPKENRNYH